jgi:hypothetical protein
MAELKQNIEIPQNAELNSEKSFPIDLLPFWLQEVVDECSISYGTPSELWATAFLAGISAATGKKVSLKNRNYINYPQLWIMIVGQSGTGKSDPLRLAFAPLKKVDEEAYVNYRAEFKEWEACGKEGAQPRWKQVLINDTTPEALYSALQYSDIGLTLYRDELSGFFDDIGRYNRSGEIGHYLSIFSNETFSVNRKNDTPLLIKEPFLNIVGTVQPSVLEGIFQRNNGDTSGFMQRFLFLFPEFPERKYNPQSVDTNILQMYNNLINSILDLNEDTTFETTLSPDAEERYKEYFSQCEKNRMCSDDFWASVYSKAEIQVLRLALTIKLARLAEKKSNFVEVEDVECAISMMEYFIFSLRKFKSTISEPKIKTSDLIKEIFNENPQANQSEVARFFGVSQQYVSKLAKSVRLYGCSCSFTQPFTGAGYSENRVQPEKY